MCGVHENVWKNHGPFVQGKTRLKFLIVSPELFMNVWLNQSTEKQNEDGTVTIRTVQADGIPQGTVIEAINFDILSGQMQMRLYNESFDEVPSDEPIPELKVQFTERQYVLVQDSNGMWGRYPSFMLEMGEGFVEPDAEQIKEIEAKIMANLNSANPYPRPIVMKPGWSPEAKQLDVFEEIRAAMGAETIEINPPGSIKAPESKVNFREFL